MLLFPLFGMMMLMIGCTEGVDHEGRHPLVEVNGVYLYEDELQAVMPLNTSQADSVAFADRFIRGWVENQLLYHQAERNIKSDVRIERLVQDYRKALVMQEYQRQLIDQKLSGEVTEEEMRAFYESHQSLFILKEPAIRGLFIKVPKNAVGIEDLKKWYRVGDEVTLEKIEKYCFRNAVIYEYFLDHWVPLSDLDGKLQASLFDLDHNLQERKDFEAEDEEFCYLLHVEAFMLGGKVEPYDLARGEILDLLINYRKTDFIEKLKKDLYDRSVDMGRVNQLK